MDDGTFLTLCNYKRFSHLCEVVTLLYDSYVLDGSEVVLGVDRSEVVLGVDLSQSGKEWMVPKLYCEPQQ